MSVAQAPVQVGGATVLGIAGVRGVLNAAPRGLESLAETGGAIVEGTRTLLLAGAGLMTVGVALMRGGRNHRVKGGPELD